MDSDLLLFANVFLPIAAESRRGLKRHFGELLAIFLRRILHIFDAMLLVSQIPAQKTFCAVHAVVAEPHVLAPFNEIAEECPVTSPCVVRFVAEFASFHQIRAVHAVAAVINDPVGVIDIFAPECHRRQKAILVLRGMVRVVRILALLIHERDARHHQLQFPELFEERPGEVEIAAVLQRVPFVRPPHVLLVDLERRIRRVHGHDILAAEIALPAVHVALVPPCQAALLPAVGAMRGRRKRIFLVGNDRRHPVQTGGIVLAEIECRAAVLAGLLHGEKYS